LYYNKNIILFEFKCLQEELVERARTLLRITNM